MLHISNEKAAEDLLQFQVVHTVLPSATTVVSGTATTQWTLLISSMIEALENKL